MAPQRPKHPKLRAVPPGIIPATLLLVMFVGWFVFPEPFVRGAVVGFSGALVFLVGGIFFVSRRLRAKLAVQLAAPPLPYGRWDFVMTAEDLGGGLTDFSEFAGQVLVLNFWATSCAPCIAEMPSLARLRDATADLPVTVACLTREPLEVVRRFVQRRQLDAPIFVGLEKVPDAFVTRAIPATYVLDKKGNIALRHVGAAAWDDPSVVNFVRGLAVAPTGGESVSR